MLPRAIAMPDPSSLAVDGKAGFFIKDGKDERVFGAGQTRAAALVVAAAVTGGGEPVTLVSRAARERGKLSPRLGEPTRSTRTRLYATLHHAPSTPTFARTHTAHAERRARCRAPRRARAE